MTTPDFSGDPASDLSCLQDGAHLVHAVHTFVHRFRSELLNCELSEADLVRYLKRGAPDAPVDRGYIARIIFKLINPYGHGANSDRFKNAALGWYRSRHPEDEHLVSSP